MVVANVCLLAGTAVGAGTGFDYNGYYQDLGAFEQNWNHDNSTFPSSPQGR